MATTDYDPYYDEVPDEDGYLPIPRIRTLVFEAIRTRSCPGGCYKVNKGTASNPIWVCRVCGS